MDEERVEATIEENKEPMEAVQEAPASLSDEEIAFQLRKRNRRIRRVLVLSAVFVAAAFVAIWGSNKLYNQMKPGWHEEERGKCYYVNWDRVTGVQEIDGVTYLFSEDGYVIEGLAAVGDKIYYSTTFGIQKGNVEIDGLDYYFSEEDGTFCMGFFTLDGILYYRTIYGTVQPGLTQVGDSIYYIYEDGHVGYGWIENAEGEIRYFAPEIGTMQTGILNLHGKKFLLGTNGILKTGVIREKNRIFYAKEDGEAGELGAYQSGYMEIDGELYYFAEDGTILNGMVMVEGENRIFLDNHIQTGWYYLDNGNRVYETGDGLATGSCVLEGRRYIFDEEGNLCLGWITKESGRYYFDNDGIMAVDWYTVDGIRYYFLEDGCMAVGDQVVHGTKYFFEEDGTVKNGLMSTEKGKQYFINGYAQTGLVTISGKLYLFDTKGVMQYGLQSVSGKTYYFGTDGAAQTGWQTVNGAKCYFGSDGVRKSGKITISGKLYYLQSDGSVGTTGWHSDNGGKFYLPNSDGALAIGFTKIDNKTYYFSQEGYMLTGLRTLGGKKYYFGDDGVMWVNTTYQQYTIDANGVCSNGFDVITDANLDAYLEYIVSTKGKDIETLYKWVQSKVPTYSYYSESIVTSYRASYSDANHQCDKLDRYLAIEALNKGKGACWHYASLMKLVLVKAGYDARVVKGGGHSAGEHNWTIVYVNGQWKHIDSMRMSKKVFLVTEANLPNYTYTYSKGHGPTPEKSNYTAPYYYGYKSWWPTDK